MSDEAACPVAMVTGASDRIGAAIAARLAQDGYRVLVHYRENAVGANQVAETIGGGARAIGCDLSDRSALCVLMAKGADMMRDPVRLLVNNASVFRRDSANDVRFEEWDAHFAIHAEAPVFLAQAMLSLLPGGVEGHVVNIIDERVLHPSPAYFSYALSKGVMSHATLTMAQSFAPRMRVNAVAPGPVLPHYGRSDDEFAAVVADLPLQRAATPAHIADTVSFLDRMKSMTGQILALDGGRSVEFHPRRGPTAREGVLDRQS